MTAIRDAVMARLHRQNDPWTGIIGGASATIQGWNSGHPWLTDAITESRPQIVVEIGVWKGASVAHMADKMRQLDHNGVVIAVDTWLGSSEHWVSDEWAADIPTLYHQFLKNIADAGLTEYVVPLRLDSLNAARLLRLHGIKPAVVHLDAGHDYNSVFADLTEWWNVLGTGGIFLGDDYYLDGHFPEVKLATDQFFQIIGIPFQATAGKCRARKMGVDEPAA